MRDHCFILFLLTPFLVVADWTKSKPTTCSDQDVISIKVPLQYGIKDSATADYKFKFIQNDLNQPAVIIIGGGPGQNTMVYDSPPILGGDIPKNYNLIYTDPRSVGCNDLAVYVDLSLTSKNVASDIVEIVKYLESRKIENFSYILYGASFGTQVATIASDLIAKAGIKKPMAVVLEGTGGHAFKGFNDYFDNFKAEWNYIKANELSTKNVEFFNSELPAYSSVLGFSAKVWGQFAAAQVILGYLPQPNKKMVHLLEWYLTTTEGQKSAQDQLVNMAWATNDGEAIAIGRLFQTIGCQEIWGEMYTGREIKNGQLVVYGENLCKKSPMSERYDSKNFAIQTPIYYMQGSHDPTTTLAHARYHFANQTQSNQKYFVNVKKAAHAPLSVTLRPCSEFIWKSIAAGGKDFAKIINLCADSLGAEVELITP